LIDFKRDKKDVPATVATIEYDPNRTARIALLHYADGEKRYIIAPAGLTVGQTVVAGDTVAPEVGNTLPLANIPLGSIIHNIELNSNAIKKMSLQQLPLSSTIQIVQHVLLYCTTLMVRNVISLLLLV